MSGTRRAALALAAVLASALGAAPAGAVDPTDALYPGVGPAGGIAFYVNPNVPAGYDPARYLAVVERSLARWGDSYAGLTDRAPGELDEVNVIGFSDTLAAGVGGLHRLATRSVATTEPGARTCTTVRVRRRVTIRVRKRVTVRRVVTVKVDGRRVRRVRYVTVVKRVPKRVFRRVPVQRCTQAPPVQRWVEVNEHDVLINATMLWELGPAYPAADRVDFETVLLHELGHASGLDHTAEACSAASPMPAATYMGDWWRSSADFGIDNCLAANGQPVRIGGAPAAAGPPHPYVTG